jgi:hypothetical protein
MILLHASSCSSASGPPNDPRLNRSTPLRRETAPSAYSRGWSPSVVVGDPLVDRLADDRSDRPIGRSAAAALSAAHATLRKLAQSLLNRRR